VLGGYSAEQTWYMYTFNLRVNLLTLLLKKEQERRKKRKIYFFRAQNHRVFCPLSKFQISFKMSVAAVYEEKMSIIETTKMH
jgi:hypothetical protein